MSKVKLIRADIFESPDCIRVNPEHIIYIKPHPDEKEFKCGYMIIREQPMPFFITKESYDRIIQHCDETVIGKETST